MNKIINNPLLKKKSGAYRRKLKKSVEQLLNCPMVETERIKESSIEEPKSQICVDSVQEVSDDVILNVGEQTESNWHIELCESDQEENEEAAINQFEEKWLNEESNDAENQNSVGDFTEFKAGLVAWAIQCKIKHDHLRKLLKLCSETLPFELPLDPRTLLETPRILDIFENPDGSKFFYYGLERSLKNALHRITSLPTELSLIFNVDGLKIFKSSNIELWPILYRISELWFVPPMTIAIHCGKGKSKQKKTKILYRIAYAPYYGV